MASRKKKDLGIEHGIDYDGPLAPKKAPKPRGRATEQLPWPRSDEDGTARGVDVTLKFGEITRFCRMFLKDSSVRMFLRGRSLETGEARNIDVDDFTQEVLLLIHRRNQMPSAFNPRRGKLVTYFWRLCWTMLTHMTQRTTIKIVDAQFDDTDEEDMYLLHRWEFEHLKRVGMLDEDEIVSILDDEER